MCQAKQQAEKEKIRKHLSRETRPAQVGDDLEEFPEEMLEIITGMDQENRQHFKGVVAQAANILEKKTRLEKKEEINKAVAAAVKAKVQRDETKEREQHKGEGVGCRHDAPPEPEGSGLEARPSQSNAGIARPRDTRVATPITWKSLLPLSGNEPGIYILWKPDKRKFQVQFFSGCSSI